MSFIYRKERAYIILAFVTVSMYFPILWNDFLYQWDDQWVVINVFTDQGFSYKNLWNVLTQFYHGQYAPVNELYYIFIYSIFGYNSCAFHAGSLILHVANVLLVYNFIFMLLNQLNKFGIKVYKIAFITALLFALHPVCVESVAWLSASKILVYSFFYLLAISMYLRYIENQTVISYILVLFFFVLSFGGKEQAVVLVLCCILIDYITHRTIHVYQLILEKIPFLLLAVFFGIVTIMSQGHSDLVNMPQYDFAERCLLACYSLFEYIVKAVTPYNLSYIYPFPFQPSEKISLNLYLCPLYLLAAGYLIFLFRKDRMILFAFSFFVIHLLVTLHIVPISRFAVTADRYEYLSLIGITFLIAYLFAMFDSKIKWIRWVMIVYIIYLSSITFVYEGKWKNSESLKYDMREILKSRKDFLSDGNNYILSVGI